MVTEELYAVARVEASDDAPPRGRMCTPTHEGDQTSVMDLDYRSSLLRRLRARHALYEEACDTMTLEQVNTLVMPGALPTAYSLVHQVRTSTTSAKRRASRR